MWTFQFNIPSETSEPPKNSRISSNGKEWEATSKSKITRSFKIYRYDPDTKHNPRIDTYHVDTEQCGPMILDALIFIKDNIENPLSKEQDGAPISNISNFKKAMEAPNEKFRVPRPKNEEDPGKPPEFCTRKR